MPAAKDRRSDSDAMHEEALAALSGLTLWRADDARPAAAAAPASRGIFERLPPLAWALLVL